MNTKTLILSLFLITSFFSYLVVRKMRSNASRAYEVILWNEYNICFLVGPEYKIKRVGKAFSYQAGKNSGVFSLKFRAIDPTMKASSLLSVLENSELNHVGKKVDKLVNSVMNQL